MVHDTFMNHLFWVGSCSVFWEYVNATITVRIKLSWEHTEKKKLITLFLMTTWIKVGMNTFFVRKEKRNERKKYKRAGRIPFWKNIFVWTIWNCHSKPFACWSLCVAQSSLITTEISARYLRKISWWSCQTVSWCCHLVPPGCLACRWVHDSHRLSFSPLSSQAFAKQW